MKLDTLLKKLVKLGAENIRTNFDSYNKFNLEIVFELNNHTIGAYYNPQDKELSTFSECYGYDHSDQQSRYHFFNNFAHVQRWCFR